MEIVVAARPLSQTRLSEEFLAPYRQRGDLFPSLLARSTYLTKYCRGNVETWTDTIRRVVEGNASLAPGVSQREVQELFHLFWTGQALPPGRGLWTGGVPGIPVDARFNCWFVTLRSIEDWAWTANQLMLGGGVGVGLGKLDGMPVVTDNKARFAIWCRENHPDYEEVHPEGPSFLNGSTPQYMTADSREGWVTALRKVLTSAFSGEDLVIDVSDVRPRGALIKTFGGIACGPGPLAHLLRESWNIIRGARGRRLTSVECLDITNHIGLCIKSGNVRRCLPGDTLVHTEHGLIPIKDVRIGLKVLTSGTHSAKFMPVTAHVEQGVQKTVEILTQMGRFRCTPNHRVAVLTTCGSYTFKMASELEFGDRLVFLGQDIPGVKTCLPEWSYTKPLNSTTCQGITVPELDSNAAWFLGYFLGDGYTRANRGGNGFNAYVSVAIANDSNLEQISSRVRAGFESFGVRTPNDVLPSSSDNCLKMRATSKQLAWYFDQHFKKPRTTLIVPDCILRGEVHVRAAFLAGLLDSDGAANNRPVVLCTSVYEEFLYQLQAVYASLGIPTRVRMNRPAVGTWQATYHLTLVGIEATFSFLEKVQPFAVKKIRVSKASQFDYGYPSEMVVREHGSDFWGRKWDPAAKQMVTSLYRRLGGQSNLTPISVLEVHDGPEVPTYDIEVAGSNEFVAGGYLVHNSALLALGSPTDQAFRDAKKDWEAVSSHRHTSNNSIMFTSWEQIEKFDWDNLVTDNIEYGEPGILNLPLVWKSDPGAAGINPCGEINLHDRESCNLAEVFPAKFESNTDPRSVFRLVTRYTLRQRLQPLSDLESDYIQRKNMRLGVGLGGICDFDWTPELLAHWYGVVRSESDRYADELQVNRPIAVTTTKPSGCRPWYSLTSTSQGLLTLEEIFENHPEGQEWADVREDLFVFQGSKVPSRVTKTYANGESEVIRLTLSAGLQLDSTLNHRWWVKSHYSSSKKVKYIPVEEWVPSEEICEGDILEVNLCSYEKTTHSKLATLDSLSLKMRGDAADIKQPEFMNPDLSWLLGYFWGDGAQSASKYRMRFVDYRVDNLRKAQRVLFEQFGLDSNIHAMSDRRASSLEVGSKMLWHWLIKNDVFKMYSDTLDFIPCIVRKSSREDIIAFVGGLLDADGWAGIHKSSSPGRSLAKFCITTAYGEFARHLQSVCWSVGLPIGLSHNTQGKNLQRQKSMWILGSNNYMDEASFLMLLANSNKAGRIPLDQWYWMNPIKNRMILGKVKKVESLGVMPTYDIEVEGTHWYYAGSVKSHNTISLLNGSSPGIHAPHAEHYIRRTRIAKNDPMAEAMMAAGVPFEEDIYDKTHRTWVFSFPSRAKNSRVTSKNETLRSQFERQATIQEWWSDNAVSATLNFNPETERAELAACLKEFVPRLKSTSCLPRSHKYAQPPYEEIDQRTYEKLHRQINHDSPLVNSGDLETLQGLDECTNGICPLR